MAPRPKRSPDENVSRAKFVDAIKCPLLAGSGHSQIPRGIPTGFTAHHSQLFGEVLGTVAKRDIEIDSCQMLALVLATGDVETARGWQRPRRVQDIVRVVGLDGEEYRLDQVSAA